MYVLRKKVTSAIFGLIVLLSLSGMPVLAQGDPAASPASPATGASGAQSSASSSKQGVCDGISAATGQQCGSAASNQDIDKTIKLVVNILSWIVGVAAVIMIIIGGFKYVTSSGDTSNVTSAKNTILFAVVGLVIVAMAQVIVKYVLDSLT